MKILNFSRSNNKKKARKALTFSKFCAIIIMVEKEIKVILQQLDNFIIYISIKMLRGVDLHV